MSKLTREFGSGIFRCSNAVKIASDFPRTGMFTSGLAISRISGVPARGWKPQPELPPVIYVPPRDGYDYGYGYSWRETFERWQVFWDQVPEGVRNFVWASGIDFARRRLGGITLEVVKQELEECKAELERTNTMLKKVTDTNHAILQKISGMAVDVAALKEAHSTPTTKTEPASTWRWWWPWGR